MVPVIMLAIDPGRQSGYGLGLFTPERLELLQRGEGEHRRALRDNVVMRSVDAADGLGVSLRAVVETWRLHGKWGAKQKIGTIESGGRWLESLEQEDVPSERINRVFVDVWRKEHFGTQDQVHQAVEAMGLLNSDGRVDADGWKALALRYAREDLGCDVAGSNEAEALCILTWAYQKYLAREPLE